jgi:hypothetical protein
MKLLSYGGDELFEHSHLFFQLLFFPLTIPVGNQALHCASGKIRDAPGGTLLTCGAKLPKLVLRDAKVN